jgi:hypothetical protein
MLYVAKYLFYSKSLSKIAIFVKFGYKNSHMATLKMKMNKEKLIKDEECNEEN